MNTTQSKKGKQSKNIKFEDLKDTDSMPFGKHMGKTLNDIKAIDVTYYNWLNTKRPNDRKNILMPFGKYKNQPITSLDYEYIKWLTEVSWIDKKSQLFKELLRVKLKLMKENANNIDYNIKEDDITETDDEINEV